MYVVATCGVFVVGVKFNADYSTLEDIRREFAKHCQNIFADEVKDVKVDSTCDSDTIVTAISFMDKFTDGCTMAIRRQMTNALKNSIDTVYTEVYTNEMLRKVKKMREKLSD